MGRPKGSKKQLTVEGKTLTQGRVNRLHKLAAKINQRLSKLEASGLQLDSKEYQTIMHYAIDKSSPIYNVDTTTGKIRVTTNLSRFTTAKELNDYQAVLKNIEASQTSTVRGTKAAIKKAQETLKEKYRLRKLDKEYSEMDYNRYREIWRIYRNNVKDKNKQKTASDTVFNIIAREQGFYDLTDDEVAEAMKWANTLRGDKLEDKIYEMYFEDDTEDHDLL